MPKRIQLSRKKGSKLPPNTVNVARSSKFGNPFNWQDIAIQPGYESKKEIACIEFERWLKRESPYKDMFPERRQWILDYLYLIAQADYIACWCKPDEYCHGDVLIRLANDIVTR